MVANKYWQSICRALTIGFIGFFCALNAWGAEGNTGKRNCDLGSNNLFIPHQWPEQDLDLFAEGKIGILSPQYDHFYLYIAYRSLVGKTFRQSEIESLRPFDPCWDDETRGYFGYEWRNAPKMVAAWRSWGSARKLITDTSSKYQKATTGQRSALDYLDYNIPNCNPDAFSTAASTLQQRLVAYGNDIWVKQWVDGQDLVFGQCETKSDVFPNEAQRLAPSWFQKDRAYQIAAAKFYAGDYQDSVARFDAIAKDTESPWSDIAPYIAARALLRQASVGNVTNAVTQIQMFEDAQSRLIEFIKRASDVSTRRDGERLLQRIGLRIDPYGTRNAIEERLNSDILSTNLGQDVRDFDASLAYEPDVLATNPGFGAWLGAIRRGITNVLPPDFIPPMDDAWLVVRLQNADTSDNNVTKLLREAAQIPRTAPAYPTARYHMIRLISNHSEAMKIASELLADSTINLTQQDKNRIAKIALPHAKSPLELAKLIHVKPVSSQFSDFSHNEIEESLPPVDQDGAKILNELMPLDTLYSVQHNPSSPQSLRKALLGVVWTRALVLKRWDILKKLEFDLMQALPKARTEIQLIASANQPAEKFGLGAVFLAKFPGLLGNISTQIYGTQEKDISELALPNMHRRHPVDWDRDNWWCSIPEGRYWSNDPIPAAPQAHPMLSVKEAKQWKQEMRTLAEIPNATDYLGSAVLEWATAHPKDNRLPEALRMIVRSARGGCISATTQGLGRRAFRHLHRHFPQSDAARTTRTHS